MALSRKRADHGSIQALAAGLKLGPGAYARAVELAALVPDAADWRRYLDRFSLVLGTALMVAGVTAFFAWNWSDLHRLGKFALIEAALVGAVLLTWRLGLDSSAGRASLAAAAFLTGVLLAVFGQVYQTGADPYGLFVVWSILILPWAIVGRQAALWLLFQVTVNLAVILYWIQVLNPPDGLWQLTQLLGPLVWLGSVVMDWQLATILFVLNVMAIVAWEVAAAPGRSWLANRVFPRLTGVMALYTVLAPTLVMILAASLDDRARLAGVSPVLFALALAVSLWYYQYRRPDLFMLTLALFGGILIVMALAVRYVFDDVGSLLILALLLIALVAGAARWLRMVAEREGSAR